MVKLNLILKKRNKKAQGWGIDLVIAIVIFTVALVTFYFYALNQPGEAPEEIENLFYDGKLIASSILSEGYPEHWNLNNVIRIGILTDNKINESKLDNFWDLNVLNYPKTKSLFNTQYEYYFFLDVPMIIEGNPVEGIGNKPSSPENLVAITRFTIYQNKPVTAHLYIWE